jgi:uncharacterized membrane protein
MEIELVLGCLALVLAAAGAVGGIGWMVSRGRARRTAEAAEARLQRLERQVAELAARLTAMAGSGAAADSAGSEATAPGDARLPPRSGAASTPAAGPRPHPPSPPSAPPGPATGTAPPADPWWSGLEENLGARLPVWLGAVALALAGAFLVKYSVDQGWIGPPVRVGLGAGFGCALLAGARLLRRPAERIAAALAAAGVAVLYAAFLAAVHLYGLLPAAAGFALMALTTAAAVALSLVHGPIVAVVGLVGGFLTPYWLRAGDPDPKRLFAYLLLLHAAVVAVSRRRAWSGLSAASLVAAFLWVWTFLAGSFEPGDGPWMQLFLLVALGAWGASALPAAAGEQGAAAPRRPLTVWAAALAALLTVGAITSVEGFGALEWGLLGLLAGGLLLLDRYVSGFADLSWLAAAVVAVLLAGWAFGLDARPGELGGFLVTVLAMGALFAGGGWAAMWGARRPGRWAALAAAAGLVLPVVAWWGWRTARPAAEPWLPWSGVALLLAALFTVAALPPLVRRSTPGMETAAAALAVAATAQLTWAAALGLEREVLSVAWALEVPALAWLAGRFRLPVLVRLAALLAAAAAVRLLLNPWLLDAVTGEPPLFNTLLWTFGAALLAFAAAAALLDAAPARELAGAPGLAGSLRWGVLALLLALVTWEVLHAFAPAAGLLAAGRGIREAAAVAVAWLVVGIAVLAAAGRRPAALGTAGGFGSLLVVSLGLAAALLGPGLALNPVWHGEPVGAAPVANHLLWIYGGPALLAVLALRLQRQPALRRSTSLVAGSWSVAALLLLFALVSLEVLQAFRGSLLTAAPARPFAEGWALSVAWLLLGTALLVAGIARGHRLLRGAALAVTGLAAVKVFLFDVARLGDLYRVLSFLGLGLSLLLLAWLYQRFVFRPAAAEPAPPAA